MSSLADASEIVQTHNAYLLEWETHTHVCAYHRLEQPMCAFARPAATAKYDAATTMYYVVAVSAVATAR